MSTPQATSSSKLSRSVRGEGSVIGRCVKKAKAWRRATVGDPMFWSSSSVVGRVDDYSTRRRTGNHGVVLMRANGWILLATRDPTAGMCARHKRVDTRLQRAAHSREYWVPVDGTTSADPPFPIIADCAIRPSCACGIPIAASRVQLDESRCRSSHAPTARLPAFSSSRGNSHPVCAHQRTGVTRRQPIRGPSPSRPRSSTNSRRGGRLVCPQKETFPGNWGMRRWLRA